MAWSQRKQAGKSFPQESSELKGSLACPARSAWPLTMGLAGLVAVAVGFCYWPVLRAQAISFDDDRFLFMNPLLMNPSTDNAFRVLSEVFESRVKGYYEGL